MRLFGRLFDRFKGKGTSLPETTTSAERQIRPCTCHPDERFYPCREKFAYSECAKSELGFNEARADLSRAKVQRPRSPVERSYVAQGFTIREYGARGHQKAESDRGKSWFYDELQPGLNGPCRVLVKNGKALSAAGERLLVQHKNSGK